MTAVWITIAVLTVGTIATKAVGHARPRRPPAGRAHAGDDRLVAPALLAALVVYETLSDHGDGITVDARAAGLGAAILAILAKAPMLGVILIAAAATAAVRAFS